MAVPFTAAIARLPMVPGDDVMELLYGEPIPALGLATRDGFLYEDGKQLGVSRAIVFVKDAVSRPGEWLEYVECHFQPLDDFLADVLADVEAQKPENDVASRPGAW